MSKGIEYKVKEALESKGFNLNYNSKESKYKPWYRIPFKVNFTEGKGAGSGNLFRRRIRIPTKGTYKTIDDMAGGLLHESGHVDIALVELPLLIYGFNQVLDQFDDPIKGTLATAGIMAAYFFVVRELIVEGYNCVRHGTKKYLKLRFGND